MTAGELISISAAPAAVSLSDVERLRDRLCSGQPAREELASLLGGYSLGDPETGAAFEAITRSLGRAREPGAAFVVSGVYGSGKSHLLAALTLLVGHPEEAWPPFLESHADHDETAAGFERPRVTVAIPLDEYSAQSHSLEHLVCARIERELALRHGVRVALTERSHLLELVGRYVLPQVGDGLNAAAQESAGHTWRELRDADPERGARVALEFISASGFPLDWRRSRADAWGALGAVLEAAKIDGIAILLDELGMFLAGKDRRGLNADASFLQYLAQRAAGERCWLVAVTQRGLEEVGDVDRRTLRQLRDRFRHSFTLGLSELGWIIGHRLVRRREPAAFAEAIAGLHADYRTRSGGLPFSESELAGAYPLNPLCLDAVQRAAEACLSQTRSAVRLLQEATQRQDWLKNPAARLITPDVAFDVFRGEMALSVIGRRHLQAYDAVVGDAPRIAAGRERQLAVVMKALCFLGVGGLRWPAEMIRGSLVGGEEADLWENAAGLQELLDALYRRGVYVEHMRAEDGEERYYIDVTTDASARIRQRLNELLAALEPDDSRAEGAALEACSDQSFPLAGLAEPRSLPVEWWHARRHVFAGCRDLSALTAEELRNLAGSLASPEIREDGWLFVASPVVPSCRQMQGWEAAASGVTGRFAAGLLAWVPRPLTRAEGERLLEHAALARMVGDPTVARPRDRELRDKLRQRWEYSRADVGRLLQQAYHEGRIVATTGEAVVETERLAGLAGQWDETLAAAFAPRFTRMFPRFASVAPERRLAGRAQTNQIIDEFIRPGQVSLPPASALEAHLLAYAKPLGLVEGEGKRYRLSVTHADLIQAATAAAPARAHGDGIEPSDAIPYAGLAGKLAKSEWGLTREMAELLIASLIRTGRLVGLDAFLQPVRLSDIAAPLGDSLPYVMRGETLRGGAANEARALWAAVSGASAPEWDLPAQEQVWDDLVQWAARLMASREQRRHDLERAMAAFGHSRVEWAWAEEALARSEAAAQCIDAALTSRQGLAKLAEGAARLAGGSAAAADAVVRWRECERFLDERRGALLDLHRLVCDSRVACPEGSLLARGHGALCEEFASPKRLVSAPEEVKAAAERWLGAYRRHYVGWHSRACSPQRFDGLMKVERSAEMRAARRLSRAGLGGGGLADVEADLRSALGRRCLAGDPLPAGAVVCPLCAVQLGEEVPLPDADGLSSRLAEALAAARSELGRNADLLRRRLASARDRRTEEAVERLLSSPDLSTEELGDELTDAVIAWLSQQIGRPQAQRRELADLAAKLRGREMTQREVVRAVEEWLGGGGDDFVEIR